MCVYTVYIHLSPQWAEPCVCSVFLEMWLWFTQKCWNNPAAWVRSSKALQIRRDTDLGQSKGLMALLISFFLEEGSEEFFLVFFCEVAECRAFDKMTYLMWRCDSLGSHIRMLFSIPSLWPLYICLHACNILYVPVFSCMSTTHPCFYTLT